MTAWQTAPYAPPLAVPATPPSWLRSGARALRAEWTKLRTLPSSWWLLAGAVAATVVVSAAAASSTTTGACGVAQVCHEDTVKLSLTGVWLGQAALLVLGVLAMGGEYASGSIRTTVAAVPRRATVLTAKGAVVAGASMVAGALGIAGSLVAGRLVLPGNGFTAAAGYPPASPADGATLRAAAGSVLLLGLVALLGLGLATLVRDTGGAVAVGIGLLYVVPLCAHILPSPLWQHRLQRWLPMPAGLSIQATRDLGRLAIGPWAGLGVLAAYAAGVLVSGLLALRLRDV